MKRAAIAAGLFAVIGVGTMALSGAASYVAHQQAENGQVAGNAACIADSAASDGNAVKFGTAGGCGAGQAGARLPISYDLGSITGTARYVATNGNDITGTGTLAAPYATLSKAISVAGSGDTIIVRGGVYRQGNISTSATRSLKIRAYPGEIPVFNGAQAVTASWNTDGALKYIPYTPQPVTDGSGISFTTGQNLTGDGVGKYPDQVWIGSSQLRQVSARASVADGKFWVDDANDRLYLSAADAGKSGIEVSQRDKFININVPDYLLEGIRVTRFSDSADDYAVILIGTTADGTVLRDVEVSESAFEAVGVTGFDDLNKNSSLQNVTVTTSNWMGVGTVFTDDFTLDAVRITMMNQFGEFASSPQSGALKTGRTWRTKVLNSYIADNADQGLWFDQSNYDVQVARNTIINNGGSAVFFEISDNLLLIDNYIKAAGTAQALKLAGSSGLKLVNNTIVGGGAPVGIYTDSRSYGTCSDPDAPLCPGSYESDRDAVRPHQATMDWIPRLDLMLNNILVYPTAASYCGVVSPMCITLQNSTANVTLDKVLHKADTGRGIPQTVMNGNVYANGTSRLIYVNGFAGGSYTTTSAFATAMAGAPVSIAGFETAGQYGNQNVNADGSPTASLEALHGSAIAIPTDTAINQYIPAGTRHYGVVFR